MRYALYYIPEQQSPLASLGASLLGWDLYDAVPRCSKSILASFEKTGLTLSENMLHDMTQEARRYGLHATLKAPFYLAEGHDEEQLIQAVDTFAATQKAFNLPALQVKRMGDFFALALQNTEQHTEPNAEQNRQKIYDFAAQCLRQFEPFRRPPTAMELARRRQKPLSPRQEEYLLRFGYPYVLEDFRFHITLCHVPSGQSREDAMWNASLQEALSSVFSPCLQVNSVQSLHLCRSDDTGQFSLLHKAPLHM